MVKTKIKKEAKSTVGSDAWVKTEFNDTAGPFFGKYKKLNGMGVKLNCGEGVQEENFVESLRKIGENFGTELDYGEDNQEK